MSERGVVKGKGRKKKRVTGGKGEMKKKRGEGESERKKKKKEIVESTEWAKDWSMTTER